MARSGEYSDIFVHKSITTGTGGQVQSRMRPDILGRTMAGKYDIAEVVSPSQTYSELQSKVQAITNLLGSLLGRSKIIQP